MSPVFNVANQDISLASIIVKTREKTEADTGATGVITAQREK